MYKTGTWGIQEQARAKKRLPKIRLIMKTHHQRLRASVLEFMGGECKKCGFSDWRALQIDHINGGGSRERDGQVLYRIILKQGIQGKYQLLCANCNFIKRYENNELNRVRRYS